MTTLSDFILGCLYIVGVITNMALATVLGFILGAVVVFVGAPIIGGALAYGLAIVLGLIAIVVLMIETYPHNSRLIDAAFTAWRRHD